MIKKLALWVCLLALAGCSAYRPVVYPNEYFKTVGGPQAEADIDQCMQLAKDAGLSESSGAGNAAGSAAIGAGTGAASGAVGGAIAGNALRGAAVGAASGATAGLLHSLFRRSEPSGVYANFVYQCLKEKGYQPVGWK